jgi:U3 small nucleolar RNA-associated protein 19
MSKTVIPNFANPLLLSDFLTECLNQEDDVEMQVLTLRGIFILLEKHNLDYPNYYKKLYAMLNPRIVVNDYNTV